MSEITGNELRNHSKNSKLKTRQDVVKKAVPNVVQALTAIVSDSKSENFKQKCCKMFEVDDTSSIALHLEARLWKIARTRLGVTSPKETKNLNQSNTNIRTQSEKDDFEDLMFFSHPDASICYEEESIKSQVDQDRTRNPFNRTSEFVPAFNTASVQNSLKQDSDKLDSQTKTFHSFSDILWNPSDSEHDLSWHLNEDYHGQPEGEPSQTDNEDSRMSGLSELATTILHVSSVQKNKLERTQGSAHSPSALVINPSLHRTVQPKKLKFPVCPQKTLPAPQGHSEDKDGDWLDNYEQDDFWMDHSYFEAQRKIVAKGSKVGKGSNSHWKSWDSNNLTQGPNTAYVGHNTTNMETWSNAVESYHDDLKEKGGLETCFMMDNCSFTATTFHYNNTHQVCKIASSQSPSHRMEAEWADLQTSSDNDQLKVCNDDNFKALADFS